MSTLPKDTKVISGRDGIKLPLVPSILLLVHHISVLCKLLTCPLGKGEEQKAGYGSQSTQDYTFYCHQDES